MSSEQISSNELRPMTEIQAAQTRRFITELEQD